jgi:signal transduction histidine kinase
MTSSLIGLEVFAVFAGMLLAQEAAARDELLLLNIELGSTRELLNETSRIAERLHIARELHDVLGHHLAALSLQLEHAVHVADGTLQAEIERAQASTRQMLSDVRSIVGTMRAKDSVDLAPALDSLVQRVLRPKLHLLVPAQFILPDGSRAHAVLRCVQEIVTNTIKHSRAENLWIDLRVRDGIIEVNARDDGQSEPMSLPGAGLTGMMERFESFGGRVEFHSRPDIGFVVSAWLPLQSQDKSA